MLDEVPEAWEEKMFTKMFINHDPFNAIFSALKMKQYIEERNKDFHYDVEANRVMEMYKQFFFTHHQLSKAKLIQIDKDLLPSIIHTDNDIFYRPMGLPVMFINEDFELDDWLIKGILVANTQELMERADPDIQAELFIEQQMQLFEKNILFLALVIPKSGKHFKKGETWLGFTLDTYLDKYTSRETRRVCKTVMMLAMNVLDTMNNDVETIDINTVISTREENDKRIKRGKPPMPTKVYIRPKSEHRTYYITLNEGIRGPLSHRFIVRGHWRHFRSERYGDRQGGRTWIKPYIKGKGLFIEKQYQIEGEE